MTSFGLRLFALACVVTASMSLAYATSIVVNQAMDLMIARSLDAGGMEALPTASVQVAR